MQVTREGDRFDHLCESGFDPFMFLRGHTQLHCPTVIRQQDTTPLTTIGKKLLKRPPRDAVHNDVVLF
jgi:hypothetical protein